MVSRSFMIMNPTGFHARPARNFVELAAERFPECEITLEKAGKRINGKSMMRMMTLSAKYGEEVLVSAEGAGEEEAVGTLGALLTAIYPE